MSADLEKRTAERKAELERIRTKQDAAKPNKDVADLSEIVGYVAEFLCALSGIFMSLIGQPGTGAVAVLVAIYLKIGRGTE